MAKRKGGEAVYEAALKQMKVEGKKHFDVDQQNTLKELARDMLNLARLGVGFSKDNALSIAGMFMTVLGLASDDRYRPVSLGMRTATDDLVVHTIGVNFETNRVYTETESCEEGAMLPMQHTHWDGALQLRSRGTPVQYNTVIGAFPSLVGRHVPVSVRNVLGDTSTISPHTCLVPASQRWPMRVHAVESGDIYMGQLQPHCAPKMKIEDYVDRFLLFVRIEGPDQIVVTNRDDPSDRKSNLRL